MWLCLTLLSVCVWFNPWTCLSDAFRHRSKKHWPCQVIQAYAVRRTCDISTGNGPPSQVTVILLFGDASDPNGTMAEWICRVNARKWTSVIFLLNIVTFAAIIFQMKIFENHHRLKNSQVNSVCNLFSLWIFLTYVNLKTSFYTNFDGRMIRVKAVFMISNPVKLWLIQGVSSCKKRRCQHPSNICMITNFIWPDSLDVKIGNCFENMLFPWF